MTRKRSGRLARISAGGPANVKILSMRCRERTGTEYPAHRKGREGCGEGFLSLQGAP